MTTTHWLDIIPAIPLTEKGLPVVDRTRTMGAAGETGVLINPDCCPRILADTFFSEEFVVELSDLRIDLDSSQGFAYALRWLQTAHGGSIRWVARWMNGQTTDADRIALAKALLEVVS